MCAMNRSGLPSHSFPSGDRRDPENDASRGDESSLDRTPQKPTPEVPADFKSSDLIPPAPPSGPTESEKCVGDAEPHRPSLGDVILKVYKAPNFISTLVKLMSEGGPPRILGLWGACEEILNSGPSNRAAIVSDIVGAVARYYQTNPVQVVVSPPAGLIGEMIRHHPTGGLAVLHHCKALRIKPIEVVAIPEVLRACAGEVLFNMFQRLRIWNSTSHWSESFVTSLSSEMVALWRCVPLFGASTRGVEGGRAKRLKPNLFGRSATNSLLYS